MKIRRNQKGFTVIEIVLVVAVLGLIGFAGWKILSARNENTSSVDSTSGTSKKESNKFIWQQTATGWQSTETPPDCPAQPMLGSPSDISKATSVLYPGQPRGGNYKPHGGFRYENAAGNVVDVKAPLDGYLIRGSRYVEAGETQYMFDIFNNCGVMIRLDHIKEVSPNLQKVVDSWPAPSNSSMTTNVNPPMYINKGDVMATKIGFVNMKNPSYDLGVYDFREQNQVSQTQAYQVAHQQDKELSWHAVCWLKDWLQQSDQAMVSKLPPADPASGSKSDYCK